MKWNLADLPWLPQPPDDFRARCRQLVAAEGPAGDAITALSKHALSTNDLLAFGQSIRKIVGSGRNISPLDTVKLGVLGNGTIKLWSVALPGSAARHGLSVDVVLGEYDQVLQDALDPGSEINAAQPDVVLLAIDYRGLPWDSVKPGSSVDAEAFIAETCRYYTTIRDGLKSAGNAVVIWQTLAQPPESLFGHLDRRIEGTRRQLISRLNAWITEESHKRSDCLFDVAALAEQAGTSEWFDTVQWNLHKMPFAQRFVPLYADHVSRILGSLRGRARKCLVLDLDNTLWGGVIGDDGLAGIRIGQGSGEGEAFLDVQRYSMALRNRGVILAVSSKNEDANARLPFREHPDMLLAESDIAAFFANWTDKATNLEAIAAQLNIGVDALVLLDDNPAERAQVRAALPHVAVPELPADPSYYVRSLSAAGYFESIGFVQEDAQRANEYSANLQRASVQAESRNLAEYLETLDMVAQVAPFDAVGRARIAQLVNKSNQFNLTTRRYTEAEVAAMETDENLFTLQVRLRDRFGDNGMISCIVCRPKEDAWEIDTWLMSCRVLGRRIESVVLEEIATAAKNSGVKSLVGLFIPSSKNEMVREHYAKLGFAKIEESETRTVWQLDLDNYEASALPIKVERRSAK